MYKQDEQFYGLRDTAYSMVKNPQKVGNQKNAVKLAALFYELITRNNNFV